MLKLVGHEASQDHLRIVFQKGVGYTVRVELLCAAIEPNISSCSGKNVNRRLSLSLGLRQMPNMRAQLSIASERQTGGWVGGLPATDLTGTADRILHDKYRTVWPINAANSEIDVRACSY